MKTQILSLLCAVALTFVGVQSSEAMIIEDFDGHSTTPYAFTNSGGAAPEVVTDGGPTGNYARLTSLTGSNNNSIAFDEEPSMTGPAPAGLRMAFDFSMSDDAANAEAGGCCGSAADGLGVGLYSTSVYGTTGPNNPAAGGAVWERPAHPGALSIGLDIFQNIDVVNLNWDGTKIGEADVQPFLDLNNSTLHRAIVTVLPNGSDASVSVQILEDVHGNTKVHDIMSDVQATGLDLANLGGYRFIAGGRTGGAFTDGRLDNISVFAIPEPSSLTLIIFAGLALLGVRRRK